MSDFKTIILKHSTVSGKVPNATDLEFGEVAINIADSKIFAKDQNGVVKEINVKPEELASAADTLDQELALKVSLSDIVNNLTTIASNKPLSAEQGAVLKGYIDTINSFLDTLSISGVAGLESALTTLEDGLANHKVSGDHDGRYVKPTDYATATKGGTVKMRLSGTTLYITNNGSNA